MGASFLCATMPYMWGSITSTLSSLWSMCARDFFTSLLVFFGFLALKLQQCTYMPRVRDMWREYMESFEDLGEGSLPLWYAHPWVMLALISFGISLVLGALMLLFTRNSVSSRSRAYKHLWTSNLLLHDMHNLNFQVYTILQKGRA